MASQKKKLRILAIHGFTQNAIKFSKSTNKLTEGLKEIAEFVFVDGTTILPPKKKEKEEKSMQNSCHTYFLCYYQWMYIITEDDDAASIRRCWWRANDDSTVYRGMEDALYSISNTVKEKGPFDGVLGFR